MNTGAKAAAVLILTLCVLLFTGSLAGTVYLYGTGAVNQKGMEYYETDAFQYQLSLSAWQYINYYYYNSDEGRKELEERQQSAEKIVENDSSSEEMSSDNVVTGSVSESGKIYPVDQWKLRAGDTVAVIPGWDDMKEGSYQIKIDGYMYNVETTADGKKRFINEDGSVAFMLYISQENSIIQYIGYIPGSLIDEYDFMNYSIGELNNQLVRDGCALLDPSQGDLCFNGERNIVWIPFDEQEVELYSMYLDSVVYRDEGRESQADHLDYVAQTAHSHNASDFENMNVHMAVYRGSAVQDGTGSSVSSENTPLTEDPVLGRYMTKELLAVSEKVTAQSVSSSEGAADVSALGEKVSENYEYDGEADYSVTIRYSGGLSIVYTVTDPMKNIDTFLLLKVLHNIFVPFGVWIILADVLLGMLCIVLFVFLMLAAGRRPLTGTDPDGGGSSQRNDGQSGEDNDFALPAETADILSEKAQGKNRKRLLKEEQKAALRASQGYRIRESFADRIPFDLFFIIFLALLGGLLSVDIASSENMAGMPLGAMPPSQAYPILCAAVAAAVAGILLCILFFMSCAVRAKIGGFLRNTLIWRILIGAVNILGKAGRKIFGPMWGGMKEAMSNIALQWKLAAAFLIIVIANLVIGCQLGWYGSGFLIFLGIVFDIAVFLVVMAAGLALRRLQQGGRALAAGDLDAKVDTSKMRGDFREHGENLNNISRGMAIAIEQRMKSERMKTELITNVSHDIKTPLTSIVNYVDLLNKENLEGRAGEYVEVLVRQSARLKKLTEDLVEASKASTGNISVSLRPVNVCEMINQAAGEYAERLAAASLSIVCDFPDRPAVAEADGRLLWRVLDNLLSNVCKYSMPGTRVYIAVTLEEGGFVSPDFTNNRNEPAPEEKKSEEKIERRGRFGRHVLKDRIRWNGKEQNGDKGQAESGENPAVRRSPAGRVVVTVKNISRERLNVASDELMERFVRGDSSRTTEGSGLGLNIARSLTELQKGRFDIRIDGDLFKAEIALPQSAERTDGII